jgi:hypothetical protein
VFGRIEDRPRFKRFGVEVSISFISENPWSVPDT